MCWRIYFVAVSGHQVGTCCPIQPPHQVQLHLEAPVLLPAQPCAQSRPFLVAKTLLEIFCYGVITP